MAIGRSCSAWPVAAQASFLAKLAKTPLADRAGQHARCQEPALALGESSPGWGGGDQCRCIASKGLPANSSAAAAPSARPPQPRSRRCRLLKRGLGALIRLFGILYSLYGIVHVTTPVLFKLLDA